MIKIQTNSILGKNATQISMRSEFYLTGETSRVFWQLYDDSNNQVHYGTIDIPKEIHEVWGEDNTPIEDYVLKQLNLERYESMD